MKNYVVASYGMGTNSTAFLIEMVRLGEHVDLILSADTGGERPGTYTFRDLFSTWLQSKGYPPITTVRKGGRAETLEQNCLRLDMLPSLAYGFKGCSHKYKIEAQEKFLNNWPDAQAHWAAGGKVTKLIGYDIDEPHRAAIPSDAKYIYRYPLLEWGWGRDECVAAIAAAELPQPGKSACFFCPASTKPEILQLRQEHPELYWRAIYMEANAEGAGNFKTIKGLGRRFSWRAFNAEVEAAEAAQRAVDTSGPDDGVPCGCYDETPQ